MTETIRSIAIIDDGELVEPPAIWEKLPVCPTLECCCAEDVDEMGEHPQIERGDLR